MYKRQVNQVFGFRGIERVSLDEAVAGDIVLVTGIDDLSIGCTITDNDKPCLLYTSRCV